MPAGGPERATKSGSALRRHARSLRARRLSPSDQAALIQVIAERLATVGDLDSLGTAVATAVRDALGVAALSMGLVGADGSSLVTLATHGISSATVDLMRSSVPLSQNRPAARALGTGDPVLWPSLAVRDRDYPEYASYPSAMASWAILPLRVGGRAVGLLSLGWPELHRFNAVEVAVLRVIAHQCAVAVDRVRIEQIRRAEREALELLSEGTRLMVSALEPDHVLESLVDLAVPRLGVWCAVYVVDGASLRRVAVRIEGHRDFAVGLRGRADFSVDDPALPAVAFRTGETRVVAGVEPLLRTLYPHPEMHELLGDAPWTGIAVPVKAGGAVIGVMTVLSREWGPAPPDEVRFVAEGLAARAGVALVNARRFEDERQTAAMLMEAFLPARLPAIPGYEVAARYLPAGSRVAGDWYDVVRLPSGRFLVGIGDAGGHGIRAASLMGQLRNCARGLAMTGHSPATVLDGLQLLTAADGNDSFATALYGELDPGTHVVRWAAAGHLPPLEYGEGSVRYLPHPRNPPLGWPSPPGAEHVVDWPPSYGIVLVTDGVVERRGRSLDDGLEALRAVVAEHRWLDAAALTTRISDELCTGAEDDCCVMVLRRR